METLEKRLWEAADQLRANSGLNAAQYSTPVLGLIFLRFAEARFVKRRGELEKAGATGRRAAPRVDDPAAYHAEGVVYLTPSARYDHLLRLPEGSNVGQTVNAAMADIEKHNPQLAGVLPRTLLNRWSKHADNAASVTANTAGNEIHTFSAGYSPALPSVYRHKSGAP